MTGEPALRIADPHAQPVDAVLAQLSSCESGLSSAEASERLAAHGPNLLPQVRGRSPIERFLLQFNNVLIYILLAAAAVTAAMQHWIDSAVIAGVVVINAIVGFLQEGKAERALDAIRRMLSPKAIVLRDGHPATVDAAQLAPGDVVLIQSGDRVPADLRLLRAKNLRIDEASLTGESVPVDKRIEPVGPQAALGDRRCIAYSGTFVTFGQGRGVVVATGGDTELGRISSMLSQVQRLETPLLRKIGRFSRWLSVAIVLLAVAAFAIGYGLRGFDATEMFMAAVGLAVAAIPEGLPAIITITLAIGVQRMAARNAIIRVLPAVEALGSVTVICSDKTGTLTRNEMTVQSVRTAQHDYAVAGVGYEPSGEFRIGGQRVEVGREPVLRMLLQGALCCNDSGLREVDGRWTIDGDPTEAALVVAARKAGLDPDHEARNLPRLDVIPFESEHAYMATLHPQVVFLKGAPERVLARCAFESTRDGSRPIEPDAWHARIDALAARGQRVLAIAMREVPAQQRELDAGDVAGGLTLLGLVGMVDPPRDEAIRAIAACHQAGIRVKMITGDHGRTAAAIATELGIDARGALTGVELERLDDAALRERVADVDVYARVSPEHKLRLVVALQERGEIVAMTGDGVNDAPALKRADVGVAMGVTGTEVSKEAAEIVLADDNFASIVSAVEEGRTVYDNLRKTILFILPTNGGQALAVLGAVMLGVSLPVSPVQILWVNMVTAVTLALALAFEPTEPEAMRRPPRHPAAPLFSRYFVWRTVLVSAVLFMGTIGVFLWELEQGATLERARTAAVNTLVLFEVFYLLNTRRLLAPALPAHVLRGNPYVPLTIVAIVLLQLAFTYAPFMHALFATEPLLALDWLRLAAIAFTVFVVVELEKAMTRRRRSVLR